MRFNGNPEVSKQMFAILLQELLLDIAQLYNTYIIGYINSISFVRMMSDNGRKAFQHGSLGLNLLIS
jgi:hypothetical protein